MKNGLIWDYSEFVSTQITFVKDTAVPCFSLRVKHAQDFSSAFAHCSTSFILK